MERKRQEAFFVTAGELSQRGRADIPDEFQTAKNLIYSSPATLAYHSPGAQGFGVKRAGLAIPGSVMLLVAPACCGRNTMLLDRLAAYAHRFFYLLQDETDIVTGRHLAKIPGAVKELVDSLEKPPTAVMICITCVDALLGTDMERVCRRAKNEAGVPVLPCYMYALTREGRVPPMVSVRKTVYALLEKRKRDPRAVNLLGEFAPFDEGSELYEILRGLGISRIREISRCGDFAEYGAMAEANFNLVLNPESRLAAEDFHQRLGIPSLELTRCYQVDKIRKQYALLGTALGAKIETEAYEAEALAAVEAFGRVYPGTSFAVGEWINADPFELSLALLRYGHRVAEIYATVTETNFIYVKKLAELSPETRIYSNLSPTMVNYDCAQTRVEITLGQDAAYYHPDGIHVPWNAEEKPFGYGGLRDLFRALLAARRAADEEASSSPMEKRKA